MFLHSSIVMVVSFQPSKLLLVVLALFCDVPILDHLLRGSLLYQGCLQTVPKRTNTRKATPLVGRFLLEKTRHGAGAKRFSIVISPPLKENGQHNLTENV